MSQIFFSLINIFPFGETSNCLHNSKLIPSRETSNCLHNSKLIPSREIPSRESLSLNPKEDPIKEETINNEYCLICRGRLDIPCCECLDSGESDCEYMNNQMHNHCYITLNTHGQWA